MPMRQLHISKSITPREPSIQHYLNEISRYERLSIEQEVKLGTIIKDPNADALTKANAIEKLVNCNLRFVVSVAKQYQNQWLSLQDLINEGNIGLTKAAEKFDATRGFKFISFAVRWIRQSITSSIAEYSRMVRLPLNKHIWIQKIKRTTAQLEQVLQRMPTQEELAIDMQKQNIDKNISTLIDLNNITTVFLDGPTSYEDQNALSENFKAPDQESNIETDISLQHQQYIVHELFSLLSDPSMEDILKMYYGLNPYEHGYTLSEIAEKYDMTTEGIRKKIHKSLKIMKHSPLWNQINGQVF